MVDIYSAERTASKKMSQPVGWDTWTEARKKFWRTYGFDSHAAMEVAGDIREEENFPLAERHIPDMLSQVSSIAQPTSLAQPVSTEPLRLPRNVEFDKTDVQAIGQQKADEFRTFAAKSQQERDAILDAEYDKTRRLANLASVFGINVNLPQRRSSAVDPAKGIAKSEANRIFTSNVLKKIQKDGKLTDKELIDFLDSQNAGPDQIKILESMSEWVELGDMETLRRRNADTGQLEYLYRYPDDITPEILAAGWKLKLEDLKYQDDVQKFKAGEVVQNRLAEIEARINNLSFEKRPKTSEEYYQLKQDWNIKLPDVSKRMDEIFSDLVQPDKPAYYTRIQNGKLVNKQMTPREFLAANKSAVKNEEQEWKPYELNTNLVVSMQNSLISNLAAADRKRTSSTELNGEKIQAITKLQFQQLARDEWRKQNPNIPIGDIERFDKQSAAAFMSEAKEDEAYSTGLARMMGMTFDGWRDFDEKTKDLNPKARLEMVKMLKDQYGDVWEYDLENRLWNDVGEAEIIRSYDELLEAHENGFVHKDYKDVKFKPSLNYGPNHDIWLNPQLYKDYPGGLIPLRVTVTSTLDPSLPERKTSITEMRTLRSLENEEKYVTDAKADVEKNLVSWDETNEKFTIILDGLEEDKGLTQMTAVRFLEKLQDPNGVIRESDVALMKAAMGTLFDDFWRLVNVIKTGEQKFLSPTETDQVAKAALVMLNAIQGTLKSVVKRKKEQFENDPYYTWSSRGTEQVSFDRVMTPERYNSIMRLDLPTWKWQTEGFGRSEELTPDEKKDDMQLLMPGISPTFELVP